jgi:TPR repeat protein
MVTRSSSSLPDPSDDFDQAALDRDREMRKRLQRRRGLPLFVKGAAIAAAVTIGIAVAVFLGSLGQNDLSGSQPQASRETSTGPPGQEASAQRPADQAGRAAEPGRDAPNSDSVGQAAAPQTTMPEASQSSAATAVPESAAPQPETPAGPVIESQPSAAPAPQARPQPEPVPAPSGLRGSLSSELRVLSPAEVAALVQRARDWVRQGNIAAARRLLEHAAEGEHGEALFALAETYDPGKLAEWGVIGPMPDTAKAKKLYEKAAARGISPAKERLLTLR